MNRVNLTLNPLPSALLESLRSIGYTLDTALADIIDNSLTALARRISVRFLWNNGAPWVAICDDGQGMSRDVLTEAMRLGSRSPAEKRKADDLGRFGLGMKTASISQCRRMTVVSRQGKTISACEWDLDAIAKSGTSEWNALILGEDTISEDQILTEIISSHFAAEKSGTIVVWRNLDASFASRRESTGEHHFSAQMDSARKHLELVFHRFLAPPPQQPKIAIDFNETPLKAFDPFGPSIPTTSFCSSTALRSAERRVFAS